MIPEAECAEVLMGIVERADRDELGAAQGAILQYALSFPDTACMSAGMSALMEAMERDRRLARLQPLQATFQTEIVAMIARTKAVVAAHGQAS